MPSPRNVIQTSRIFLGLFIHLHLGKRQNNTATQIYDSPPPKKKTTKNPHDLGNWQSKFRVLCCPKKNHPPKKNIPAKLNIADVNGCKWMVGKRSLSFQNGPFSEPMLNFGSVYKYIIFHPCRPILVTTGVITPINGLGNWGYNPTYWSYFTPLKNW